MANKTIEQMNAGGILYLNDTGTAVPQLRTYLATAGYAASSSSSSYDSPTRTKVLAFQTAFGPDPDGDVGPITWNMLKRYHDAYNNPAANNSAVPYKFTRNAAQVTGVSNLQAILQNLGYPTGSPDGRFGSGTLKSVLMFQLHHTGLTVDGIAGSSTISKASTINGYSGGRVTWGKQLAGGSCKDKRSSMTDSEIVARCMYGESENDATGLKCVAQVIQNRVRTSGYPSTVSEVVFQANAFTSMLNVNDTCVAPDRSSSKWANTVNALGSAYSSSAVYNATLKNANCVRFRTATNNDRTTTNSLVAGGNYFYW